MQNNKGDDKYMNIYDEKVKTRKGETFDLSSLKGKVSLVVNTATGCGSLQD